MNECPDPATALHRGHLMRMEACTRERETWKCVGCGLTEIRPSEPRTRRLMRGLNAAAKVGSPKDGAE